MKSFWQQALSQAVGGLIIVAVGGIGFLCYSLPRQLDQVLQNQRVMADRFGSIESRVSKAEDSISGLQIRVTKIEAR